MQILKDHLDDLHTLAVALLEYETLSGDEIKALLKGEDIRKDEGPGPSARPPQSAAPTSAVPSAGLDHGEPQPEG